MTGLASFIHPDDREAWRQSVREALESGQRGASRIPCCAPGRQRPLVRRRKVGSHGGAAGKPPRLLGVSIDITDRRQVEERLRTSEALSTGVLASLPGQMVIVDRSGIILRTSDTWQEFAAGDGALDPTVLAVGARQPQASPRAVEEIDPVAKESPGGDRRGPDRHAGRVPSRLSPTRRAPRSAGPVSVSFPCSGRRGARSSIARTSRRSSDPAWRRNDFGVT